MSKPKLIYFPMPGRGEPIRLAFYIGGIDFEDERVPHPEFAKKKQEGAYPYGSVPVLHVGNAVIAQSNAILRYAGKSAKLYPTDQLEAAKVDELLDTVEDVVHVLTPSLREQDEGKKKEMREKLAKEDFPKWFGNAEKQLEKFGKGPYAVGNNLTIADLKIAGVLNWLSSGKIDHIPTTLFDTFPRLKAVQKTVNENPKVKEWQEKHK